MSGVFVWSVHAPVGLNKNTLVDEGVFTFPEGLLDLDFFGLFLLDLVKAD